jgi:hypothetical protein
MERFLVIEPCVCRRRAGHASPAKDQIRNTWVRFSAGIPAAQATADDLVNDGALSWQLNYG